MDGLLNESTDGTSTFFKRIQKIKVSSVFHIAHIKQKPLPYSGRGYQPTALLSGYEANLIAFQILLYYYTFKSQVELMSMCKVHRHG